MKKSLLGMFILLSTMGLCACGDDSSANTDEAVEYDCTIDPSAPGCDITDPSLDPSLDTSTDPSTM